MILVIITNSLRSGMDIREASSRAWQLNLSRCYGEDYLVAVSRRKVAGVFKIVDVEPDDVLRDRVKFTLDECTKHEIEDVMDKLIDERLNFSGTKYL